MNHDFEHGTGQTAERRSRRNPKLQAGGTRSVTTNGASRNATGGAPRGKAGKREAARKKRRNRIIAMIVAECFALAFIFGYAYFLRHWNKIQRPDFELENVQNTDLAMETVEKMKGYWTIAIFGVDSRDKAIAKGTNADVNMICNINQDTGEIRLVSVYRDTYLKISDDGTYNKLNQAYFVGGPEQAVAALNRNLDLNISDYMTFNWKAVADAINILGGVDIELSDAEFHYINGFITETVEATGVGSRHLKHAGMNHLDGVQAVAYGRLRLMDTDYARTERQRKVIAQAFEKARQADFDTLNRVLGTVFPQVATSINVNDIFLSLKNVSKYHLGETSGFPQARGDANMGKKGSVVVPQTLETNVVKLHEFLFGDADYATSETVKSISAKIAADTGMYKEGKYVGDVGTDGGVIQKPKATQAATETAEEETEEEINEATDNETDGQSDADGETDEDGNRIEPETDEDGSRIDRDDEDPDEPETDEYGRPLGTVAGGRPGSATEPETDGDGNDRVTYPTTSWYPGTGNRPDSTPAETTAATRPGGSAGSNPTAAETTAASRPGVTTAPGGSGSSSTPGIGGSSSSGTPGSSGSGSSGTPGTSGSSSSSKPGSGVISAPGASGSGSSGTPGSSGSGVSGAPGTGGSGVSSVPGTSGSGASSVPGSSGGGVTSAPGSSSSDSITQFPGGGSGADSPGGSVSNGPVSGPGQ